MKRDMELVRAILLALENDTLPPNEDFRSPELARQLGRDHWEVFEHLWLMTEAGLIHSYPISEGRSEERWISGITWEGYDFLDAIRSERIMAKITEAAKPLGGIPFAVMKALAIEWVKDAVGLGAGPVR